MKIFYFGSGLLFAGLVITGALLTYFDIPPGQMIHLIRESNYEIKVISSTGIILSGVGCVLLMIWIFSGGEKGES